MIYSYTKAVEGVQNFTVFYQRWAEKLVMDDING